jgi:hypothetical protein
LSSSATRPPRRLPSSWPAGCRSRSSRWTESPALSGSPPWTPPILTSAAGQG